MKFAIALALSFSALAPAYSSEVKASGKVDFYLSDDEAGLSITGKAAQVIWEKLKVPAEYVGDTNDQRKVGTHLGCLRKENREVVCMIGLIPSTTVGTWLTGEVSEL